MRSMHSSKMLIDGKLVNSVAGKVATIYNPATKEPVAEVSVGVRIDAQLALDAARIAFPTWSETHSQQRGDILHEAARLVRQRVEEIATLLTCEQGKPLKDSRREVLSSADVLDYYAEEGKRNFGQWVPAASQGSRSLVVKQPIGVAAIITPWNLPVDLMAWKVGPALAAGCTVVAKPPSLAPLAATAFIRAVNDAGVPPGVVNVVHGSGSVVGAELVENPVSRKIAFTGETATGRWIMEKAARHIKRVSLGAWRPISLHRMQRRISRQSRVGLFFRELSPTWGGYSSASTGSMLQKRLRRSSLRSSCRSHHEVKSW